MSNIISLGDKRAEKEPHLSGDAYCLHCGNTWQAVAPVGTDYMECPECHTMRGVFMRPVYLGEESHFTCACGSQFFRVIRSGVYCPCCGSATPWDELQ